MLKQDGVGLRLDPAAARSSALPSPVVAAPPRDGNVVRGLASAIVLSVPVWLALVAAVVVLLR